MKFRLKLNPIYKKEMKQSVRSIKLPLFLVLFNSILAIISLIAFYVTNEQVRLSGNIDYRSNIYLYIFMISMEFALLVFIIPAMSSGLISGERERQTLDILLTLCAQVRLFSESCFQSSEVSRSFYFPDCLSLPLPLFTAVSMPLTWHWRLSILFFRQHF